MTKGGGQMHAQAQYRLRAALAARQRDLADAHAARILARDPARQRPIRRLIGRTMIRLGHRLAAEPHRETSSRWPGPASLSETPR
jgi:hypothetical protein